ncbi:hypothetical protein [Pseudomonas sp. NPDC089396]|uniref:hypothetical protein n=1 Tax=Pseudomonas sp. NPDC089396 TaxID=3364461 RepID=UPI003839BE89
MAGDWIKMRVDLQTHPKVFSMVSALKADRLRVVGALHATWCVFDTHSVDGVLTGYSLKVLDGVLGWSGFSAAMVAVDWLVECEGGGLAMPSFDTHNGKSAKRRANDSERKRASRKSDSVRVGIGQLADKVRTNCAEKRDQRREEKKREEKSFTASTLNSSLGLQIEGVQERTGLSGNAVRVALIPTNKLENDDTTAEVKSRLTSE